MADYELNFADYWRILRRRKFVIIFTTVVVMSMSFSFAYFQPKEYSSFATIKVEEARTAAGLLLESIVPFGGGDVLETETNVIMSWPVAERAARSLGYINDKTSKDDIYEIVSDIQGSLDAEIIENTNLIKITCIQDTPQRAADITNAIAQAYIKESFRSKSAQARKVREFIEAQLKIATENLQNSEAALQEFKSRGDIIGVAVRMHDRLLNLKSKLSEMIKKYTEKHPMIGSLKGQIKDLEKEIASLPPREIEFARLNREFGLNEESYATFREKLEEARITEAANIGDAVIVDIAVPNKAPVAATGLTTVFLGLILGGVLGVVFGFIMESTDTSIGAIEDVENLLKLSVLGVIPNINIYTKDKGIVWQWWQKMPFIKKEPEKHKKTPKDTSIRLIAHYAPKSPIAEAYRILRTNIQFSKERKVVLFTSTLNQEGKSTVVSNLALTAAQLGSRTLLLSCDMRKPVLADSFGLKRDIGISDVLTGGKNLEDVIQGMTNILMGQISMEEALRTPGLDNLSIITAGRYLMNPAELLGSEQMKHFIARVREMFDIIIIDSPPVLPVTDALILAPMVDSVIMVYQVGRIGRGALLRAKAQLEGVNAKILGIVLNHVRPETTRVEQYYYPTTYYGREEDKDK
ncbi:GumC family protein [Candidatus Omnitrophota bacterium]